MQVTESKAQEPTANHAAPPLLVVLGTGGTIAGTAAVPTGATANAPISPNWGYRAGQLGVAQLLQAVPPLAQQLHQAGWQLHTEQVAQVDSKDMDFTLWEQLALRCAHWLANPQVAALLITHGTDTLEETAWLLHLLLPDTGKPVVLTAAMRPATALAPDGPQNLLDAAAVARHPQARGVLVVLDGVIHSPRQLSKLHPLRLDAFASTDSGPLGWVDGAVAAGDSPVRWAQTAQTAQTAQGAQPPSTTASDEWWAAGAFADVLAALQADAPCTNSATQTTPAPILNWPWVEIVSSHAGSQGAVVQALQHAGVAALVVAATGNATVHQALDAALCQAEAAGVVVWVASRCPLGRVREAELPAPRRCGALSPVKARVALLLTLLRRAHTSPDCDNSPFAT